MSIESTEEQSPSPAVGKPYGGSDKRLPEDAKHSSSSANGDAVKASLAGEAPVEVHNPDLPVHPTRNLPKWLMFNLFVPIALLAAAFGLVWYLGTVESPARPPIDDTPVGRLFALPAVDVVPVRSLKSTGEKLHLSADGTVVPFREVSLATEVAGQIVEKSPLCEAGKYVTKGQVLMRIDPTDYELEVKRLQRQRQQEYEALGEVDQEMVNTKRSMELARADIELQRRELKRQEALPNQFASQGELDQARRALLAAEQQLVLYQNQLDLAQKRRTRLESAERLAAMQLEAAENNLRRTEIVAPITGVVVSEQAEINTFVARGSPVVTIEDTSKVEVAAKLRIDQLYWVLNQRSTGSGSSDPLDPASSGSQDRGYRLPPTPVVVSYVVSGREGLVYQWTGNLIGYDGIGLDQQTRTVPVRIVVDDPQDFHVMRDGKMVQKLNASDVVAGPTALVRGMFVKLRLEIDPAVELVVLPSEALKPGNRIWQFVPDASVLDVSIAAPEEESPGEESSGEQQGDTEVTKTSASETVAIGPQPNTAEPTDAPEAEGSEADVEAKERPDTDPLAHFDASAWIPGNLVIRQGIRPVDKFISTEEFNSAMVAGDSDEEDDGSGQWWICEVPDNTLVQGSFVVVSPVGNLRSDVFPVRASSEVVGEVKSASGELAELTLQGPAVVSDDKNGTSSGSGANREAAAAADKLNNAVTGVSR
ncbi:efflux RND transporter periplasmic adaptor subunit [Aporhodopirellula aestuarii]|uniref:HlyD family efflux transporter periplasmic adaptor subunit n=1 Tax=Aporhodopirellula aestuarii TaxID=2950107 RepID=A0ABT0U5V0_9BACT|nr:HlyD family efflux transporter periplasmic adaptor subunit [Aporhodopirellula aestuarii]MCM2372231.1 HlyD family efflux transporter periplasmic adaptor subunit [Aporhodopirellula aestuarii]